MWKRAILLAGVALAAAMAPSSLHAYWFPDGRLTFDPAISLMSINNARCIATDDSGFAHVVWADFRDGDWEIYYKKYDGVVWGPDARLTNSVGYSGNPAVAVRGDGTVHVVWDDYRDGNSEIYYKKYDGLAWSADERLTAASGNSQNAAVATDGANVHVVWHDFRDYDFEVYHKKHNGAAWLADERLTNSVGASMYASVATNDSGRVFVAWNDYRDGDFEIYYKEYDGTAWSGDARLTTSEGSSQNPCVSAGAGGNPHVVWSDRRDGDYEIYHKAFTGGSWGPDERLTVSASTSQYPSIASVGPDSLNVVWSDNRDGNSEVYYKRFDGLGWGASERLSDAPGTSQNTSIAVDAGSAVHVVWSDDRDGNSEIYWKRTMNVLLPDPVVDSIDPESGVVGSIVHIDDLAGQGFAAPARVRFQKTGQPDIVPENVIAVSPERIVCDIDLLQATDGPWDVVVENPDSNSDTLAGGFIVIGAPKPEITSIDPDSASWGGMAHIDDLAGAGFMRQAFVWLSTSEGDSLAAANVNTVTPEQITCDFDLGAAVSGSWDVMLENPDGQRDTMASGFYVIPPPVPVVDSLNPDGGLQGRVVRVDVLGSGFRPPVLVWLGRDGEDDVHATNIWVNSGRTRISCYLNLIDVADGFWDVVVQIADGQRDTLAQGFLVTPGPAIYSIEPNSGGWSETVHIDAITGRDFYEPMAVWLSKDGASDVVASNVIVETSDSMTCVLDLGLAPFGIWDVFIENSSGQAASLPSGFRIIEAPAPVISAVSPDSGYVGFPVHIDSITGANFLAGARVRLKKAGESEIPAAGVVVLSSDRISCDFNLVNAVEGYWDVVVVNPDIQRDSLAQGFRVGVAPAPVVSAVSPDSGYVGFPVHIDSITGANFLAGAGVQFQKSGESSIIASDVVVGSPGFISCDFDLTGAAVGPWDVVVVNPDGQRDTLAQGFQISTASAPEIHSIDPAMGDVDDVVYIRALEGTGFLPTTAPRLEKPGEPDIAATNITIASPESITCYFDLTDVAVGYWDVVVENGDGQQDILEDGFTVLALPIVDLIDPESWEVGETVHITNLAGRRFFNPVAAWLSRDGEPDIHATNIVIESAERITMDLDLSSASDGVWDVVIKTLGVNQDTLSGGFTVLPYDLWFPEVWLTMGGDDEKTSPTNARSVAVGPGGRVYVVWEDDRDGSGEIYFRQYNGTAWESEHPLTDELGTCSAPAVAVDASGAVHVVWVYRGSGEWKIRHDVFDGVAWRGNEEISTAIGGATSCAIAADGAGNVYVVWLNVDNFTWDVFFRMYDGSSWRDEERVTDYWSSKAGPSVACDDSGNVHVAWYDHFDDVYDSEIYCARYDGSGWSAPERISYGWDISWTPCVAAGPGDEAHVVWTDRRTGFYEVRYCHYDGMSWGQEVSVTDWEIEAANASVTVDPGGTVHVVWRDLRAATEEIYHSLRGGGVWTPTYRLSTPGSSSRNPSVAADQSGKVHVVWKELAGGSWDIRYRAGYPGAFAGTEAPGEDVPASSQVSITPNPVSGSAEIRFLAAREVKVAVSIYDIEGRLTWRGESASPAARDRGITWDCCDMGGRRVSPGIYFVHVTAASEAATAKVVVLR